jgi:coenzyme F420-dependent glucose-6-phosphate dehydrogenase
MPAALERTEDVTVGTGVSAMIHRYHPGNVAHRLATLAELYPDRVFLGLGSGEALNESPLGLPMPAFGECAKRTAEGIRMVRALFEEEFVSYDGQFWSLDEANLYTGPDVAPPIYIASNGPTLARMAGDLGDGYVTVFESPERVQEDLFPAVRRGIEKSDRNDALEGLDRSIHLHVSYDPESESAALEPCLQWRGTMLDIFFEADVADPRTIQRHGDLVDPDHLREHMTITTDPADILDVTAKYVECGFDHIVYQSHSPDQGAFAEMLQEEVFPSFENVTATP